MSEISKLQLASLKESYKDQYYDIYLENSNFHTFAYSEPKNRDKFDERFQDSDIDPCFVLVDDKDNVIGFCGVEIARLDGWAEINYMISSKFQNKGYGKILLDLVIKQLQKLKNIEYLEAITFSNPNSDKLLISLGFTKASFWPNYRKIIKDGQYITMDETGYYLKIN